MNITISVSEKAEQKIRQHAAKSGKRVDEFVGQFVEEALEKKFPEFIGDMPDSDEEYENPFTPFIAMFASGKTDTSIRYKEILSKEIDKRGGFGGS